MNLKLILCLSIILFLENVNCNYFGKLKSALSKHKHSKLKDFSITCLKPVCDTEEQRNILWPHLNPYKFWQCAPVIGVTWGPVEKTCAAGGILFSFDEQVCVWPEDWENPCGIDIPEPTPGPTTHIPTNDPGSNITVTESPDTCYIPKCKTSEERNTLFPHEDRTKFWQCAPIHGVTWGPVERKCAADIWFCKKEQVCVWPRDWTVEKCGCNNGETGSGETTITTEKPTPTKTTDDPGSNSTVTVDPTDCYIPKCKTSEERNTLFPHADRTKFWQCAPVHGVTWGPVEKKCAANIWFCKKEQVCVWPRDWTVEECGCGDGEESGEGGGSTPSTITTTTDFPTSSTGPNITTTDVPIDCYIPKCNSLKEIDTLFAHSDNSKFWKCVQNSDGSWSPEELDCPSDQWFCKETESCTSPNNWDQKKCGCDEFDPSEGVECHIVPDCKKENLQMLWPHTKPAFYWKCEMYASPEGAIWKRVQKSCPKGANDKQEQFDFKKQSCVLPEYWEDYCLKPTDPEKCSKPFCHLQEIGTKYPHRNPRNWYECISKGEFQINECPFGFFFDFEQQNCIDSCEWKDTCKQ